MQDTPPADALYRDRQVPTAERVEDLLARMTLDEKLAQIGCVWCTKLVDAAGFSREKAAEELAHGTGHITRIGASTGLRPAQSAHFANEIQRFLVEETRLGIPAIVHEESCAGFTARDATQFPQAIGLAATWQPELAEAMGVVIRQQMLAVGARHTLAPVLDVARDPRWGRTEETFGEDPYLVSRMGVAYVRGVQGDDRSCGVVATGKHFIGYGLSEGGMNHAPVHLGPRELREVYARPFEAAIQEAGLGSVMNAYNELDGLPCGGSKEILEDLLRGELGFDGLVVADYFTTRLLIHHHHVAADKGDAGQIALEAGIDVELPQLDCYGAPLRERIEAGRMPVDTVDRSVRRLLRMKFELGLFENAYVDAEAAPAVYDTPAQRSLAGEIAAKSIVLLRNEGGLLPLADDLDCIAVIGPSADDIRLLQGDYSYPAHLEMIYENPARTELLPRSDTVAFEPGPHFPPSVSLLDGIRAAVSEGTRVVHAWGCGISGGDRSGFAEAIAAASEADVAVVAVGGKSGLTASSTSGEFRDASDLGLTGVQQALVEQIVATGTPVVVVLINGRPLALPWIAEHVPAIVEAWLPGEEGGNAVADVLFGRVNPAGRLPVSLPRHVGQVPVYYRHKSGGGRSQMLGDYTDGSTTPLWPFGHGLSYTQFAYGDLRIEKGERELEDTIEITIEVTNTGDRAGDDVVQLYVRDEVASVTRPVKQLVGFVRLPLDRGRSATLRFELDPSQLALCDADLDFVIEPGEFQMMVGSSSSDIRAEARVTLEGKIRTLGRGALVPTRCRVG